ncbi:hypothetical protein [uncultured Roseovarius sp.]|uniref:hypothetical protein n=1 Tax=uncultured Roseovarius sp. TaxID=293344 RepID=UPI0026061478|nr:hypothetical protein [uncultured Roseovarius sp.]
MNQIEGSRPIDWTEDRYVLNILEDAAVRKLLGEKEVGTPHSAKGASIIRSTITGTTLRRIAAPSGNWPRWVPEFHGAPPHQFSSALRVHGARHRREVRVKLAQDGIDPGRGGRRSAAPHF